MRRSTRAADVLAENLSQQLHLSTTFFERTRAGRRAFLITPTVEIASMDEDVTFQLERPLMATAAFVAGADDALKLHETSNA